MDDDSTQRNAAARALLGDELASPPSESKPSPVPIAESTSAIPPAPLPELALEYGTDLPSIQRGAAWCLAASLIWGSLALLWWGLSELFTYEPMHYISSAIFLLTVFIQLQGLSHLQRIEPIHRAREYLELSWLLFLVMAILMTICFVVMKLQIGGGVVFGLQLVSWLSGVGFFWTLLFGLRRIGIYLGELRVITQSYLVQILLGIFFAASIVKISSLIQSRQIRWLLKMLPDALLKNLSTISPTILVTVAVAMLLYIHVLWLLWRASLKAQRQASIASSMIESDLRNEI